MQSWRRSIWTLQKRKTEKKAFEIFQNSRLDEYDVIIMDVMMPVMDGLEATKAIRMLEREDAKKIPIIAMTANAFEEDRKACLEAGMNEHIGKPIDIPLIKKNNQQKPVGDWYRPLSSRQVKYLKKCLFLKVSRTK